MSLRVRLYEKKRGTRRTGSRLLGSAGLAVFFALFFAGGCSSLLYILWKLVIPEWRANRQFAAQTCTVLNTRVAKNPADQQEPTYRAEVQIRYVVDGRTYKIWTYDSVGVYSTGQDDKRNVIAGFEVGKQYPCWYDPRDPSKAVVKRGFTWFAWITLLLPACFMIIGGGGLGYTLWNWGKSAERRSAQSQHAPLDLFEGASLAESELPGVPRGASLTDSPGTRLKYRLPIAVSTFWALLALIVGCLLWNGMVAVFAAIAVDRLWQGRPDWLLTALLMPFVAVGAWLIYFAFQQLIVRTGIGPTFVEISDHPLLPGKTYQVCLSQSGRLTINRLAVQLVCEERATYQQGTNSRTDVRRVYQQEVFRREAFEVRPGSPLEQELTVTIPPGAMHSFRTNHNEIAWKIAVHGDVADWPAYQRHYPIIVHPGANGKTQP